MNPMWFDYKFYIINFEKLILNLILFKVLHVKVSFSLVRPFNHFSF